MVSFFDFFNVSVVFHIPCIDDIDDLKTIFKELDLRFLAFRVMILFDLILSNVEIWVSILINKLLISFFVAKL